MVYSLTVILDFSIYHGFGNAYLFIDRRQKTYNNVHKEVYKDAHEYCY